MEANLSDDLVWSLRALAQNAETQRVLYPAVVVADELVLDFDDALRSCGDDFLKQNSDLAALDAHIASKSGIPEFWSVDALENDEFWIKMRALALSALEKRGLETSAPDQKEHHNCCCRRLAVLGSNRTFVQFSER